jgi:hypothetical protein
MTALLALLNVVLGLAYTGYGVMTIIELKRDWQTFGFSHFGAAWIVMAFTCGPHHLAHGIHLGLEGRPGGQMDLLAVVVGLPAGVLWLLLRIEAFAGGRGDRFVVGTPRWLRAVPGASAVTLLILAIGSVRATGGHWRLDDMTSVNLALLGLYLAIGWVLLRTQLANRPATGGWSVSGLCLSAIFPTCGVMHAVWAAYAMSGQYHWDVHGFVIDWLSVPAALYFLYVVRRLHRESLHDWNHGPEQVEVRSAAA